MNIKRWILPGVLSLAVVGVVIWGAYERSEKARYENYLNGMYEKSFYELVDTMGNLEVKLSKLIVAEQPDAQDKLISDIWRQSYSVSENLSQLPASSGSLETTMSFVNQLGEYCMSLKGQDEITEDNRSQLKDLHNVCKQLTEDVNVFAQSAMQEGFVLAQPLTASGELPMDGLEKTGIDYPTLIYDGPYSSAAVTTPKGINQHYYDYGEAEQFARDFIGTERISRVHRAEDEEGDIPSWGFEVETTDGNTLSIHVTRFGGHVHWMLPEDVPGQGTLDAPMAIGYAKQFLQQRGYENMQENYWQIYGGVIVVNFVPLQDGVLLYPDLVKVQVSLATGEVLGFESGNYLRNHVQRDLPEPEIPQEEALESAQRLSDVSVRLCVIPLNATEVFCYEIQGTYDGEQYLIYVDAETGDTANILKILSDSDGMLVI